MILPIGKDGFSFRRMPWVTIFIIIVCIFIHAMVTNYDRPILEKIDKLQDEYIEFYMDHPYFPFARNFIPYKKYKPFRKKIEQYDWYRESRTYVFPENEIVDQARVKLDGFIDDIIGQRRQLSWQRWGYKRTESTFFTHFSHFFLHADWRHVLFNMLFFFFVGAFLEELWGYKFYFIFYILCGLFSTIGSDLIHPTTNLYSLGASGAVSGVIGAFLARFWNEKVRFIWWGGGLFSFGTFTVPGWMMVIFEVGREFIYAKIQDASYNGGSSTGYWAHFSGLVFGILVVIIMKIIKVEKKVLKPKLDAEFTYMDRGYKRYVEIREMITKGLKSEAYEKLKEDVPKYPRNSEMIEQLWILGRYYLDNVNNLIHLKKYIEHELKKGRPESAMHYFDMMRETFPKEKISDQGMIMLIKYLISIKEMDHAKKMTEEVAEGINEKTPEGIVVQLDKLVAST